MNAGCVTFGYQAVVDAVKDGRVRLVLLSDQLSENTAKKVRACCDAGGTPYITAACPDFGPAIGKINKLVIGVTSENFKKLIINSQRNAEVR